MCKTIKYLVQWDESKINGIKDPLIKRYYDKKCVISYCRNLFGSAGIAKIGNNYKAIFVLYLYRDGQIMGGRISINDELAKAYKMIKCDHEAVLLPPELEAKLLSDLV